MTRYAIALLLLAVPLSLTAQDAAEPADGDPADADKREVTIVLEEPAKTVEEAMNRRAAKEAEAQKLFDDTMAAADRHAVADLAVIARQAVADGRLPAAAEAWTAVEQLEPENEQARAFFKVVGHESQAEEPTKRNPHMYREVLGTWKWVTGSELTFQRGGRVITRRMDGSAVVKPWKVDVKNQTIVLFSGGTPTDVLQLTRGGRMMEGKHSSRGKTVDIWAVKISD